MKIDLTDLQASLRLSANLVDIVHNQKVLQSIHDELRAAEKLVMAFKRANESLCQHKNVTSYSDPRDSGWNCHDCGASR